MAEGLKNNQNFTNLNNNQAAEHNSPKQSSSRGSPALSTELKKESTIKSFRSSRSLRSNLKNITSNNQSHQNNIPSSNNTTTKPQNNNGNSINKEAGDTRSTHTKDPSSTKRTVLKSIRNLFFKASINLSIAAARLKSFAEDALSSDEIVNELFLVTSSSSVDSSLLEIQEEPISVDQNNNNQPDQAVTGGGQELANTTGETESRSAITSDMTVNSSNEGTNNSVSINELTFENFDAVAEAKKLHREKGETEPFIDGDIVWAKRREAWLYSTPEERTRAKQKSLENSLVGISKDNYPIIYNSLIEKQKTLKKPMNLKDALKVINAGWIASKKWERATQGLP